MHPHSPDMASSDYHLFDPLNRHLSEKHLNIDDDVVAEVVQLPDAKFYKKRIHLMHHWEKCVNMDGDYLKK